MALLGRLFRRKPRITKFLDEELRERLTPEEYRVTNLAGTEYPYSGEYRQVETDGTYHCRVCDAELFSSDTKFDPTGAWPAFRAPIDDEAIAEKRDFAYGIPRTETLCAECGAHLGHVFPEGAGGADTRYCINSVSLRLEPADDRQETTS